MNADEPQAPTTGDLNDLSDQEVETRARHHFDGLRAADGGALQAARTAGQYLREHKRRVRHGGWLKWLGDNYSGSEDLAGEAMRIAEHWVLIANWLAQDPALTKTAALRRLREHRRPPVPTNLDPGGAEPLAAGGDLKCVVRHHRTELGDAFRAEVAQLSARTAFVIGALPELRPHLLTRISRIGTELGPVGELLGLILERIRRGLRGEPEFQTECDAVNPRPAWCPECRTGSCQCHTAESYDEVIRTAAEPIEGPLTALQALVIRALIRSYAKRLRPVERELLDGLVADGPDPLPEPDHAADE
ncbi:MAG TPA: hypothetical protein VGE74_17370 [Gemmata sp.]